MLDALRRPLPLPALAAAVAAAAVAVAVYCVAYTALAGRPETFAQSLAWAVANICPWLVAIEAGKRANNWIGALAMLAMAFIGSVAVGYLLEISSQPLAFEAVRRLPALIVSAAAIALLRSGVGRAATARAANDPLPLLPRQIDWVQAAGNYVELRSGGRTIIHRSSIGAAERDLAEHGFVRIHRSILVRRDRIARIRPQDVVLVDGTQLKIGKRYRSDLAA